MTVRNNNLLRSASSPDYLAIFGRNLRAARLQAGLSSAELAARSGVELVNVSRIEAGLLDVRLVAMAALAGAVGRSRPELLAA